MKGNYFKLLVRATWTRNLSKNAWCKFMWFFICKNIISVALSASRPPKKDEITSAMTKKWFAWEKRSARTISKMTGEKWAMLISNELISSIPVVHYFSWNDVFHA